MSNPKTLKPWHDPDDAPELTDDWFKEADQYEACKLVKRGRTLVGRRAMALETYAFDPAEVLTDPKSRAELLQDASDTRDATYIAHAKAQ